MQAFVRRFANRRDATDSIVLRGAEAMKSEPGRPPTLVINPSEDDEFRSYAEALVENGPGEPTQFQECLRLRYPDAIVRPRELAGEQVQIWYVYRDGHWIRSGRPTDDPADRADPA